MFRAKISIKPPFDMKLSLKFATACRFESENDCREGRFHRLVDVNGIPILLTITTNGNIEKPTASIRWELPEDGRVGRAEVVRLARHIISADLDLIPFYNKVSGKNKLAPVIRKFRGLKPILTPSVYESAAWAIMGQQVNLNFAYTLKKRIADKYGRVINLDGRAYQLFPDPDAIARARIAQLRAMQFSQRKAEYLIDLSKSVSGGMIKLEEMGRNGYNEALECLLSVRGIGIWSANYILMRGAGHLDCLPLGDSGLHRAVRNLYNLKSAPDNEKVKKQAESSAPYRSLYTLYLWYSLMSD